MSNLNNTIKVNKLIMFGHGFIKEIDNESQKSSVLLTVVCGLIKSMTTKTPQNQPKPQAFFKRRSTVSTSHSLINAKLT